MFFEIKLKKVSLKVLQRTDIVLSKDLREKAYKAALKLKKKLEDRIIGQEIKDFHCMCDACFQLSLNRPTVTAYRVCLPDVGEAGKNSFNTFILERCSWRILMDNPHRKNEEIPVSLIEFVTASELDKLFLEAFGSLGLLKN